MFLGSMMRPRNVLRQSAKQVSIAGRGAIGPSHPLARKRHDIAGGERTECGSMRCCAALRGSSSLGDSVPRAALKAEEVKSLTEMSETCADQS